VSASFAVPADSAGARLDVFLTSVLEGHSRSNVQRLIKEGHVHVDGRTAKANQPMKAGQTIVVELPEPVDPAPQAEALPLPIVYQDSDLIVIDKPAGMVVHPAAGHAGGTLVNALLHHVSDLSGIGGEKRPGIVHRLDRGTSGLMVVAKNDAAHEELSRQFQDREVEKEYIALVWGEVQSGRRIDAPIGRDPVNRKKMSARARRSREAVTRIVKTEKFGVVLTLACLNARVPPETATVAPASEWMRGLDVTAGYQVTWLLMFADYTRYNRSGRAAGSSPSIPTATIPAWRSSRRCGRATIRSSTIAIRS